MAIKILVVDDSKLFRKFVSEALASDPEMVIVGTANDGLEAVAQAQALKPDVITMDVEMPRMDGIQAVREIMKFSPVPILMFSSLTQAGAKATLEALDAGAADFLPKKYGDLSSEASDAQIQLRDRVRALSQQAVVPRTRPNIRTIQPVKPVELHRINRFKMIVIGASTGGPVALQQLLAELPPNFPCPILIVQHIPPNFSTAFAERADQICALTVTEVHNKEYVEKGCVYVAPGGKQISVEREGRQVRFMVTDSKPRDAFKPCIDDALFSLADTYGASLLTVILTGMGNDGTAGCKLVKRRGGQVWAQDKRSSVVFGMPASVYDAGLTDKVWPLSLMAQKLYEVF